MKKLTKKDYLYMLINIILFIIFISILCENTYLYGSSLDWISQHITIPEYFRTLFYSTKDFLPDFALNLGSGQNIYNLSYYGFLSPIILISYLLPFIPMSTYIIVSTIILCLLSSILIYIFLHKKNFTSEVCFISSFILLFTTSMTFHSHRHIMFINYMPFLILGLFGVDKKIDNGKSWLLTLSTFLMIMTSYYFSIGGIICIFIYALYRYLNKMNIITIKTFLKTFISILVPIIIAIIISSILTLPTLSTILNNRLPSTTNISIRDLFLPDLSFKNIIYRYYGIGLSAIIIPAIINFFKPNKANITLGLILIIISTLNIINYILNGFMYIDSKSLIPFLPLFVYVIATFIQDLINKNINLKLISIITIIISIPIIIQSKTFIPYIVELIILLISFLIYKKVSHKLLIIIPLIICIFITTTIINKKDTLVLKDTYLYQENTLSDNINIITQLDNSLYRINNNLYISETPNNIYGNINYLNSTIYSSTSNINYNIFYYDKIFNNLPTRNRALTVSNQNVLFQILTGNKYLISSNKIPLGYEQINSNNGIYIYKNENVFPIGFSTSNIMNYDDFNNLSDQVKQEALLNVIVTDSLSNNNFVSNTNKIDINYEKIFTESSDLFIKEKDGSISLNTKKDLKVTYKLPKKYQNKIIFIRFKMNKNNKNNDLVIKINNVKNKLTSSSWKYYNQNEVFTYTLDNQNQTELNFIFSPGEYNISDFETYILDYANIEKSVSKLDRLMIDTENTKGDIITGTVNVVKNGYFMFTIPYDDNFEIKVDNKKIKYEKVDGIFIGFKITEGTHDISLEYHAPLKYLSCYLSIIGIFFYILITYFESKRKYI